MLTLMTDKVSCTYCHSEQIIPAKWTAVYLQFALSAMIMTCLVGVGLKKLTLQQIISMEVLAALAAIALFIRLIEFVFIGTRCELPEKTKTSRVYTAIWFTWMASIGVMIWQW